MKRFMRLLPIFLFMFILTACGKSKQPELSDGAFIKLSTKPVGELEVYNFYTVNVEIYQDGAVKIYADDFKKWMGEEECPVSTTQVTQEEVEELKRLIEENNLYNMREDVGNKDSMDGDRKYLTLYTVDGEHVSGGLNPSNRAFNKIYDYINDIVREELYNYKLEISEIQEQGYIRWQNMGIDITNEQDNVVLSEDSIDRLETVYIEIAEEDEKQESGQQVSTDMEASLEDADGQYKVAVYLNEEGAAAIMEQTAGCSDKSPQIYYLYINDVYETTIYVDYQIVDGILYLSDTYTKEEADAIVEKISDILR